MIIQSSSSSSDETYVNENRINLVDLKKKSEKDDEKSSTIKTTKLNDESESSSEANVKAPPIKLRFCETCRVEVNIQI